MPNEWGMSYFNFPVTDVDIANMALSEIGGGQITDLTDKEEVNIIYKQTRDALLASYPWAFCKARMTLYPSPIELANSLKALLNAHGADADIHPTPDTTNFPITTEDATSLDTLYPLVLSMLVAYQAHNADAELADSWIFHRGQEDTMQTFSLESVATPTTQAEAVLRLNDLRIKYNLHDDEPQSHTTYDQHQEDLEACEMPAFEYDYSYYLPADYLGGARLWYVTKQINDIRSFFLIEGKRILSNETKLDLSYQSRVENTKIYSRIFIECFALNLAAKLAMAIAQDKTLSDALFMKFKSKLQDALAIDVREGNPDETPSETTWNSR